MNFRNFDLNLLRCLDVLLQERNVTRAAKRLHITQQALSGSLRRLRDEIGDPLLVRAGRDLELTPRGAALAVPVREVLSQIERTLETHPSFRAEDCRRRFSVAMSDYATTVLLAPLMAIAAAETPGIVLEISMIGRNSPQNLLNGELDLCLLPNDWTLFPDEPPPGLRSQTLYEDDFVCIVGASNTSVGKSLEVEQYLRLPHTALRLGGGVCSLVDKAWKKLDLAPHVAAPTTSFTSMVFLVAESPLVATVPRRFADRFARSMPIRVMDCPVAIEPLQAGMSWRLANDSDPAHRYLREARARAGEDAGLDKPGL